jgi:hypothetical protein
MMLKILSKYIRYSGIWAGLVFNPYHWEFRFDQFHPDDMNPNMRGFFISFGPLWIRLVLDDGSW